LAKAKTTTHNLSDAEVLAVVAEVSRSRLSGRAVSTVQGIAPQFGAVVHFTRKPPVVVLAPPA
jgi:hypothetical protein